MEAEERIFQAYSKISEQFIKEDARVHERMTWGVSINGALFALLGAGYGLLKESLRHATWLETSAAYAAVLALALVAIWICYNTIRAIGDARKQIYYVRS